MTAKVYEPWGVSAGSGAVSDEAANILWYVILVGLLALDVQCPSSCPGASFVVRLVAVQRRFQDSMPAKYAGSGGDQVRPAFQSALSGTGPRAVRRIRWTRTNDGRISSIDWGYTTSMTSGSTSIALPLKTSGKSITVP